MTAFLHYLESGQYQSAVELLVDADGNPLDDSSRSAHVQAWLAVWGTQPDIHIAEIKFVDRAGLSTNELVKLHTSHGYKLTFNTLGKSATACFKVPVERATMVAIATGVTWHPVEEFHSQYVPPTCSWKTTPL